MFEQIIEASKERLEIKQRKIVIEHIDKLLNEGYIFVAEQIKDDVDYICKNASSEQLIELFQILLDLKVECKGQLLELDSVLGGKTVELFHDYLKQEGEEKVASKLHAKIEKLSKEAHGKMEKEEKSKKNK